MMKSKIAYSRMDPLNFNPTKGRHEQEIINVDPEVKVALINVAGKWAVELQKSNPNPGSEDLLNAFRDVYSSLLLLFLVPEV